MIYSKAFFLYATVMKICDALTLFVVWRLTWLVRFEKSWFPAPKGIPDAAPYERAALPLVLVFCCVFHIVGAYRSDRIPFGFRTVKKIVQGAVLGALVFVATLYFLWEMHFSRIHLAVLPLVAIVALVAERAVLHLFWKAAQGRVKKLRTLLIGHGEMLSLYYHQMEGARPYPIHWIGRLGPSGSPGPAEIAYLGDLGDLEAVLQARRVGCVVISFPPGEEGRYTPLLDHLSRHLADVKVVPDYGRESTFSYHAGHECGIPLLVFNRPSVSVSDRFFKRLFDIVGSLCLLVLFSPVFLVVAILVKLTSRGPIFYSQTRMGADGKLFPMYKFRSMEVNAESETGPVWAKEADSRTTPFGAWLRKTSLDEIPQFLNVLKGHMSLVGPRPERPMFVEQFRRQVPRYMLRHKMKSGITGWAQINGWRGNSSLEERIHHDLYYIGHWSHRFDLKILVLTVIRGFVHRNAY